MHTHLNFVCKWVLHFSTLAIKLFNTVNSYNCQLNTMNQSPFKCLTTRMIHPILKPKCSVLFVMKDGKNYLFPGI